MTSRDIEDARHAARGGGVQLLAAIAQILMPAYHMAAARLFGQAAFGLYSSALAVVEVLTRLGLAGGDKAMLRYLAAHRAAGEEEAEQQAFGTAVWHCLALGAGLAVATVALAYPLGKAFGRPYLYVAFPFMAPAIIAAPVMLLLMAATLARKVTRVNFVVRGLVEPGVLMVSALGMYALGARKNGLWMGHGLAYLLIALGAAAGTATVFGWAWLRRSLRHRRYPGFRGFALPIAGSEIANGFFQRTDMLLLPMFVHPEQVAAYFAGEFLGRIAANVRYAFDGITGPVIAEILALGHPERLRYNFRLYTRWVATLSLPLAATMIALRTDLLSLYGAGYRIAGTVVVLHTLAHLLSGVLGLAGQVILMSGRSRMMLVIQAASAAGNFFTCLVLIPRLGFIGAAVSVLASMVLTMVAMVLIVARTHNVHAFCLGLLKPFVSGAAALAAQLAVARAVDGVTARMAAVIAVGLCTYLATLLALGLAKEEREILAKLWARLARRGDRTDPH